MKTLLETCRKFGQDRLAIAEKAQSPADWMQLWYDPINPYPFTWGSCWKGCIEYRAADYAVEIGFWLDLIGLDSNTLSSDFTMLMSPDQAFYFAVVPTGDAAPTPADAIRIQFMLQDIVASAAQLQERGIEFEQPAQPESPGSPLYKAVLRTPAGIAVDLWGIVSTAA